MTAEELKLLENLTNEIQELNRILTISVAAKYAEILNGNPIRTQSSSSSQDAAIEPEEY